MISYYYRDTSGQEIGPLNLDALAKLRLAGVLDNDTPVRATDSTEWKPCREIISLPDTVSSETPQATKPAAAVTAKFNIWQYGWSFFAIAALCFLLPFVNISCSATKQSVTLTGQQLVTGTRVEQTNPTTGRSESKTVNPVPEAGLALGLAIVALIVSLVRKVDTTLFAVVSGAAGVVALYALEAHLERDIAAQGRGLIQLSLQAGFWLAGAALAIGAVIQLNRFVQLSMGPADSPYKGYGGWLAVFCFGQGLINVVTAFVSLGTLWEAGSLLNAGRLPNQMAPTSLFMLVVLGLSIFGFFTTSRLRRLHQKAIHTVRWYLVTALSCLFLGLVVIHFSNLPFNRGNSLSAQEGEILFCGLIGFIVWYLYFSNSKRIHVTFLATGSGSIEKRHLTALGVSALIAALLYGGLSWHNPFSQEATLSFSFSIDGKAVSASEIPGALLDGLTFTSGNRIGLGHHYLVVQKQGLETFQQNIWVFYGNKNLGTLPLETSKGSLLVAVNPSPATVIVQHDGKIVDQGNAPLKADKLPVGDYTVVINRGKFKETYSVSILREQETVTNVVLNLGIAELSSDPPDAEFEMSGNGHHWEGKLPTRIEDVPVGTYSLAVTRKGWEQDADISVTRGGMTTNKTEFLYGSIEVTSDPTGLAISTNGVEIGETPLTLQEVKPGKYTITVSDGENDLMADVSVGPKKQVKHRFAFRYSAVQITSTPSGAAVVRKGKEIGKTPLTIKHIPAGESEVDMHLDGYATTNFMFLVLQGVTTNYTVKLVSDRYLQAMKQAEKAEKDGSLADALNFVSAALKVDPDNKEATELFNSLSFKIHCQNAQIYSSKKEFEEALAELTEAEKLFPGSQDVVKLRQAIEKQKLERFNSLTQDAANFSSRGQIDEANQDLIEAEKLVPNSSKVAELRARIAPALREELWKTAADGIANSAVSQSHIWKFNTDLAGARHGVDKALNEFLSGWKVQSEANPNDQTITMILGPSGIGKLGSPYSCVLMLSQVGSGVVEIRSKMCVYQSNGRSESKFGPLVITTTTTPPSFASQQSLLNSLERGMFSSFETQFGQPL